MHPRLVEEWDDIVAEYPDVRHELNPERVALTLELVAGIYNRDLVPIAVLVPPGYRTTGPDGFVVPSDFGFADGEAFPAGDAAGLGLPGWQAVSFHMMDESGVSTWRPTADPSKGDN